MRPQLTFTPSLPLPLPHVLPPHRRLCTTPKMTAFRKYHGLGNDFILIDNRRTPTPLLTPHQASTLCDRHTGVGADGVIFLLPPSTAHSDATMRLYNADGSEPEMCGNGIRCLARFASDLGMDARELRVDTGAGVIVPRMTADGLVQVDMGAPVLEPSLVPTKLQCRAPGWTDGMEVGGKTWEVTAVSMGNPHAVVFVGEEVWTELDRDLESVGPEFERHEKFPKRTNTEFVKGGRGGLDMLVWERGSGRTRACGTGACAVVVAAVLTGRVKRGEEVVVGLPGGDLRVVWEEGGSVLMTGPAELVFEGEIAQLASV